MTVVLVAGPPGSGKSTYVAEHRAPGDVVLDWDVLFAEVSSRALYDQPSEDRPHVEAEWRTRLLGMTGGWLVSMAPRKQHRAVLRRTRGASSIVLEAPPAVCIARINADSRRPDEVKREHVQAVYRWWAEYEPSVHDTVLRSGSNSESAGRDSAAAETLPGGPMRGLASFGSGTK